MSAAFLSISPIAPRIVFIQAPALPFVHHKLNRDFSIWLILLSSPDYLGSLPFFLDF
jgi:hypothetical protein